MKYTYQIPKKITTSKGEEVETNLKGKIVCNVPGYAESGDILNEIRFKADKNGEMVPTHESEQDIILVKKLPKYVESVEVKSADDAFEIKTLDDLGAFSEGKVVISKLAKTIFGGISLSKK